VLPPLLPPLLVLVQWQQLFPVSLLLVLLLPSFCRKTGHGQRLAERLHDNSIT